MGAHRRYLPLAAVLLLAAAPLTAEVYTVTLNNGNTFETQYRPRLASSDGDKILLITEQGNWISLLTSDVADVTSQTEMRGFGKVINTTTIELGEAPNDLPDPGAEGQAVDSTTQLLNYLTSQQAPVYNVEQFAEPNTGGGIPLGFTNSVTPPLGAPIQP